LAASDGSPDGDIAALAARQRISGSRRPHSILPVALLQSFALKRSGKSDIRAIRPTSIVMAGLDPAIQRKEPTA
jgi:hypothetical protein